MIVIGTDPLDMEATLTSPSGKIDTCEIRDLEDSLCQINFTPNEEGVHTISLKFKGIHFAGKLQRICYFIEIFGQNVTVFFEKNCSANKCNELCNCIFLQKSELL